MTTSATSREITGSAARRAEQIVAYTLALVVLVVPSLFLTRDGSTLGASTQQGYDFAAYYRAGRAILEGMSPYPGEMLAGPFLLNLAFGYFYPPPFAVAMVPLALLPPFPANAIWTVLLAAGMLVAGATIAGGGDPRRAAAPGSILIGLALGLSTPGLSGLVAGNVSSLLGVLALPALLATRRQGLAGAATAIAVLIKLGPAIWGAYLLGAGRLRAVVVAAATGLAIVAATYALPSVRTGWAEYPTVLANSAASERVVAGRLDDNQSVAVLLELPPPTARVVEGILFASSALLMLVAGRVGMRLAPLAAAVGMISTPSVWLHSCLVVAPAALTVVALGPGVTLGRGGTYLSGPRLAEALAAGFACLSYVLLFPASERLAPYALVLLLALAAALAGPRGLRSTVRVGGVEGGAAVRAAR